MIWNTLGKNNQLQPHILSQMSFVNIELNILNMQKYRPAALFKVNARQS